MDKNLLALALRECVGRGRDVVLAPNGRNSAAARELLLREYGREPRFFVDSSRYDGVTVFSPEALPEGAEECAFLITADHPRYRGEMNCALRTRIPGDRIVMPHEVDPEWKAILSDPEKVRLDFLGVGFSKCLTTSVYTALYKNPNIFLSRNKESRFLDRRRSVAEHKKYKAEFRPALGTGRLTGAIEPLYSFIPELVHAYHGDDVKLLFFLRDPVKALYSYFKMSMRNVYCLVPRRPHNDELELLEKYGRVCPEMFDEWVDRQDGLYWKNFLFGQSLQYYLTYYPREQMRVVLSEDLLSDTPGEMHELQRFIGLPEEKCVDYPVLPRSNEGKTVSRDYLCALVNKKFQRLPPELYHKPELIARYYKDILPRITSYTQVEYNEPPLPETVERLRGYFRDDVRLLEELLGRSLQGLWT